MAGPNRSKVELRISQRKPGLLLCRFREGTGAIFGKGMKRPRPGRARVIFGAPLTSFEDENTRRYNARIESAVGRLTEESVSDYWTAARSVHWIRRPT